MELDELAERLSMLEGAQQQGAFMDKYGTRFSGDEGIGMAILAEMNRRGVNAAAIGADRVVQEILDTIRQEATAVLDKIRMDTETVNSLIDQVQDVQAAVDAAVSGEQAPSVNGVLDLPPPAEGAMPAEDLGGEGLPPPPMGEDMGPPPEGGDMGGAGVPPPDVPGPEMPMAGEMPPPEEEVPPPPPPPPGPPSDTRVKKVLAKVPAQTVVSDKRTKTPPKVWKPSSHLINTVRRGMGR